MSSAGLTLLRRGLVAGLTVTACLTLLIRPGPAVEPLPPASPTPATTPPTPLPDSINATDSPPLTLVVLASGQVMEGTVRQETLGYMVTLANGEVLIPFSMVRTAAASRLDAYQRMRDGFVKPSANDRIELAKWCLDNGLADPARQEALAALRLEPDRREARLLLQQVERQTDASSTTSGGSLTGAKAPLPVTPRSTAGIPRAEIAQFVRQVQPLLVNRCGNARCHGSASDSRFQLESLSSGLNRYQSDLNLSRVLGFLDPDSPLESLLLIRALEGTGPHRDVFTGSRSDLQRKALSDWVEAAAPHAPIPVGVKRPNPAPVARQIVIRPEQSSPEQGFASTPPVDVTTPTTPGTSLNHVDEAFLRKILAEEQPDAFDPEKFNRMIHGTEARTMVKQPVQPASRE